MTKKSERLQLIIELYSRQERDALLFLGRAQQKLTEQQTQLEQLRNYRIENKAGTAQLQASGLSITQFMELKAFADKLDKAIAGQNTVVAGHEQEVLRARKNWEESHQRIKNLQKITEKARVQEVKAGEKREQTEQDARAARSQREYGM